MRLPVFLLVLVASPAAGATPIDGPWITDGRTAIVTIGRCGATYCGRITKVLVTKPGMATTDAQNPDPAARKHPLVGLTIISGFTFNGGQWRNGRIYDPESGKTYRSRLAINPDGSLKVSGCIAFFCQSQRWTRR